MQIKVFKAGNMKDAMAAMKAELGDEAIILHSKKYKEGGLLGIGSREVVEITAAVEELSLPKKTEPTTLKHPTVAPASLLTRYKTDGTEQAIKNAESAIANEKISEEETLPPAEEETPSTAEEETPSPAEEEIPSTAEEETPSPAEEETPSPAEEETLPPAEEETPSPAEEETLPPAEEETLPPAEDETPSPAEEETLPPAEEETSSPAEEEIPSTAEEETPSPAEEETPSPAEEETPSTAEEETPSTAEEETPSTAEEETPSTAEEETLPPPPQSTGFTQEQMAQTQAMLMEQFNQMQMIQQAAIAQAQAQVQAQAEAAIAQVQAQARQAAPPSQNEGKIQRLEEEIAQMKALLAEVLGRGTNRATLSLHEALRAQEVDEDILTEMAAQSNPGDTLVDVHSTSAKPTLIKYLNEHVKFSDGIKLNRHGVRIVALLGTTGVGKTTTLAKIAAKFVLEQRTNVALITADTYRISAVEQLKTYSDILELPLEIVYNPQELASALERYRDRDLVLIDTAGRSQHNDYQLRELEEFLRVNPRIEKHLVISATTKATDARQIIKKFSQVEPDRIIFTKIDETNSLGMIINLLHDKKFSLSYITTGQSVPDDIERASNDILVNSLFKKIDEQ